MMVGYDGMDLSSSLARPEIRAQRRWGNLSPREVWDIITVGYMNEHRLWGKWLELAQNRV